MNIYLQKLIVFLLIIVGMSFNVTFVSTKVANESYTNPTETNMTQVMIEIDTRIQTTHRETLPSPKETVTIPDDISLNLFIYLSEPANGRLVGDTAVKLNHGDWHNACVYVVSEALRRVGYDIPVSVNRTEVLVQELENMGFVIRYDLSGLQPGDICFTTDEEGKIGGRPTHSYIFLSWKIPGVANIFDNQIYDYESLYHTRNIGLTFFNNKKDRPKEATAFFMRK